MKGWRNKICAKVFFFHDVMIIFLWQQKQGIENTECPIFAKERKIGCQGNLCVIFVILFDSYSYEKAIISLTCIYFLYKLARW